MCCTELLNVHWAVNRQQTKPTMTTTTKQTMAAERHLREWNKNVIQAHRTDHWDERVIVYCGWDFSHINYPRFQRYHTFFVISEFKEFTANRPSKQVYRLCLLCALLNAQIVGLTHKIHKTDNSQMQRQRSVKGLCLPSISLYWPSLLWWRADNKYTHNDTPAT